MDDGASMSEGDGGELETIYSVCGLSFSVPCITSSYASFVDHLDMEIFECVEAKTPKKGQERERSIIQKKGKVYIIE